MEQFRSVAAPCAYEMPSRRNMRGGVTRPCVGARTAGTVARGRPARVLSGGAEPPGPERTSRHRRRARYHESREAGAGQSRRLRRCCRTWHIPRSRGGGRHRLLAFTLRALAGVERGLGSRGRSQRTAEKPRPEVHHVCLHCGRSLAPPRTALACAAILSTLAAGCAGSAQLRGGVIYDYPVYYVDDPPPRIYRYPQAHYHGRPAYLVDGRWYYSTRHGWAYFRQEPRELRVYRERHAVRRRAAAPPPRYRVPRETRHEEPTEGRRRRYESD